MTRHSERAARALRRLAEDDPAFAALGLWCAHRDAAPGQGPPARAGRAGIAPADGPAWSDDRTIYYAAAFSALPDHEQVGLAAHHILHVAFRHATRAKGMALRLADRFDADLYGLVTDAIVNETLTAAGYVLPRPCPELTPLLRSALKEDPAPGEALARWDADALYIRLRQTRRRGEGADDDPEERAKSYAKTAGYASDMDWSGAEPETAQSAAEWRERIARALAEGRAAGRGLGMVGHRLGDLPRASTAWEVVLRGFLAKAVSPEPQIAWRRPARSWLAADSAARAVGAAAPPPLPAVLRDLKIPRIAVCVDCSGSVDDARLGLFAAQIAGIGRRLSAEIHVLVFDTELRSTHRMGAGGWEEVIRRIAFARGGGTDFGPVLAAAAALDPSAIVVLTDLDGPLGSAPGMPVLWAVPDAAPRQRPAFGRVLSLAR
ncbi:MAG: VWA-like domain-containing protein [Pseudomonadota bacterium]